MVLCCGECRHLVGPNKLLRTTGTRRNGDLRLKRTRTRNDVGLGTYNISGVRIYFFSTRYRAILEDTKIKISTHVKYIPQLLKGVRIYFFSTGYRAILQDTKIKISTHVKYIPQV